MIPNNAPQRWHNRFYYHGAAQDVDIAIIKATTSKFSVVPKEKHVRSAPLTVPRALFCEFAKYIPIVSGTDLVYLDGYVLC